MAKERIAAEVPGVFYLKPSPEEAPFKAEGDGVAKGETLGLIEVMKNFFPVVGDIDGRFVCYVADNGQAVEIDDILMEIES